MQFLFETLRLGFANLLLHKMRSVLTALGIIFGVAAVIAVVAIGEGNKRQLLADIEKLGARNIIIRSIKPQETQQRSQRQRTLMYGLTRADYRRLEDIQFKTGLISRIVPLKLTGTKVSVGDKQEDAKVFGTTPDLLGVTSLHVERGRYLTEADEQRFERVAVIGAEVARRLFPLTDPLDGHITVHNGPMQASFKVVGLLRPVGLAGGAGATLVGRDLNFDVHIPIAAAQEQFGDRIVTIKPGTMESVVNELEEIYVESANQAVVRPLAEQVKRVIEFEHLTKGNDATVFVPLELLEQSERTAMMFTYFLGFIAGISLLVGGIGIMNIMLATVTERTREIGIRRALGATRRHITAQFLVEITTLAGVGGIIGVGLGLAATAVLNLFHEKLNLGRLVITPWSIGVSLGVAVVVGIVFGLYPAMKAARQDPIVALRHD